MVFVLEEGKHVTMGTVPHASSSLKGAALPGKTKYSFLQFQFKPSVELSLSLDLEQCEEEHKIGVLSLSRTCERMSAVSVGAQYEG